MYKFIAFSDIHINTYRQFNDKGDRLTILINLFILLFKKAGEKNADILFSGDLVDNPTNISFIVLTELVRAFKKCFDTFPNLKFYYISGNHCFENNYGIAYTLSNAFPNNFINITDGHININDDTAIWGIGFKRNREEVLEVLQVHKQLKRASKVNILLTHQTVEGTMDEKFCKPELFINELNGWDLVINGHIHHYKELTTNIVNIGSPCHRHKGDMGKTNYYLDIEVKDNKLVWNKMECPKTPIFKYVQEVNPKSTDYEILAQETIAALREKIVTTKLANTKKVLFKDESIPNIVETYLQYEPQKSEELYKIGVELLMPNN